MGENSNKSHFNSVLLGVILGVGITLLFTTKKGKKIFKAITEEGLDRVSGLQELFSGEEGEESEEKMPVQKKTLQKGDGKEEVVSEPVTSETAGGSFEEFTETPPRFFRGIPKRNSN